MHADGTDSGWKQAGSSPHQSMGTLCYLHWTRHLNLEVPFTDHPKGIDSGVPAHSVKQDGSLEKKKTWAGAVLSSKNRKLGLRVS